MVLFVPSKLVDNEIQYCQRLPGRPVQAFDDKGEIVWQTSMTFTVGFGIWKVKKGLFLSGSWGQYEDRETGLYYNRPGFDPNTGNYISR